MGATWLIKPIIMTDSNTFSKFLPAIVIQKYLSKPTHCEQIMGYHPDLFDNISYLHMYQSYLYVQFIEYALHFVRVYVSG